VERCEPVHARILARLSKQIELALAGVDLSMSQYRVLVFLAESDDETAAASALAALLDVSRPSVTALIDGLVARGLVERRPSTDDRRRVEHRITPDGAHVLGVADHAVTRRLDVIVNHVPDRAATTAVHGLEHWGEALSRAREGWLEGRFG